MSWWERAYLFEIVRGLSITGGVFVKNMWRWMTLRKGALTTYYPEETRADYAPRNRGKHVLTQRPDGSPQCIACNMCATVCPAKVIEIEAGVRSGRRGASEISGRVSRSTIRAASSAGLCVEACPEDAIRMVKEVPNLPALRPQQHVVVAGRAAHLEPAKRRRQALPAGAAQRSRSTEPDDRNGCCSVCSPARRSSRRR